MQETIIIAEAGVNHNGDMKIAKKLIEASAFAGADYVKFQSFKADSLVTKYAEQAKYRDDYARRPFVQNASPRQLARHKEIYNV